MRGDIAHLTWEYLRILQEELERVRGKREVGIFCLAGCHTEATPDKWKKMDEWMESCSH